MSEAAARWTKLWGGMWPWEAMGPNLKPLKTRDFAQCLDIKHHKTPTTISVFFFFEGITWDNHGKPGYSL